MTASAILRHRPLAQARFSSDNWRCAAQLRASGRFEVLCGSGAGRTAMKLGLSRNAVLSLPFDGRKACERDGFCMWGCRRGAIYNSVREIDSLSAFASFTYQLGCLVERIEPTGDGYRLEGRNPATGKGVAHAATRVVVAAGTVASTRLVLPLLARLGERRRLLNNPAYTFAVLFPSGLGRAAVTSQFAMAQLSYILRIGAGASARWRQSLCGHPRHGRPADAGL